MVKDKHIRKSLQNWNGNNAAKNPKLASGTWQKTDHAGITIMERKDSAIEPHHLFGSISIYRSQRGTDEIEKISEH